MSQRLSFSAICFSQLAILFLLLSCGHRSTALREPEVDTLWVAPDGQGDYVEAREALLAAERLQREYAYSDERPLVICFAPHVYWIDDPDDPAIRRPEPGRDLPYGLDLTLSHVRLIGLGSGPEDVVLASNRGQTQGADGNFTMLHFVGDDITAENLTFGNYCNVDLDYKLRPELSRPKREEAIVQAQLIIIEGDRVVARHCHFISRLNSCPFAGARRALFDDCYFECTDDALCSTAVYLRCRFTFFSSKPFYITEGTGAVFLDCDLHSLTRGEQHLVKVGSPVAMVNCRWTSEDPGLRIGWTHAPTLDQRSYQYNVTLNGRPLLVDVRRPDLTVDMTGKQVLGAYVDSLDASGYNLYNLLSADDGWNPTTSTPTPQVPVQLVLSQRAATIETGVDTLNVKAVALCPHQSPEHGAKPSASDIRWFVDKADEAYLSLSVEADGTCTVVGNNHDEEARTVCLKAETKSGLQSAVVLTVMHRQLPAPSFTSMPALREDGDVLTVDYEIDRDTHADRSLITWYRSPSPDGRDAVPVAVTRGDKPLNSYTLTADDNGYYIVAGIQPKHTVSLTGEEVKVVRKDVVNCPNRRRRLQDDFHTFPTARQPMVKEGWWTVDSYKPVDTDEYAWDVDSLRSWTYGFGIDGASDVEGLIQEARGARLMYTPTSAQYGDMTLTLVVAPCKTAGQGFGSATGQYMDVCLKMDTKTLTGYGLRIIRTPKNDRAVDFLLIGYDHGVVSPLTEPLTATCYRSLCTLQLRVQGSTLTAHVETTADPTSTRGRSLPNVVDLQAPVPRSEYGGIAIQHTGSVGQGSTVLKEIRVEWETKITNNK